jgi:hypothetical protein
MSARRATVGPEPFSMSATTPVRPTPVRTGSAHPPDLVSATIRHPCRPHLRKESSGCRWKSRRRATIPGASAPGLFQEFGMGVAGGGGTRSRVASSGRCRGKLVGPSPLQQVAGSSSPPFRGLRPAGRPGHLHPPSQHPSHGSNFVSRNSEIPAARTSTASPPGSSWTSSNRRIGRVPEAVAEEAPAIARAVELIVECFRAGGRLFYVGAGTSGRLGVLDASEMPPTYGTDPSLVQGVIAGGLAALVRAQEGAEDHPEAGAAAMDERVRGLRRFCPGHRHVGDHPLRARGAGPGPGAGARTGFLLCTPPPPALRETHDVVIAPLVGPELITGSTRMKAGTATKLVLNTLTTSAMVLLGRSTGTSWWTSR